jgi:CRISP-associated protein Cas1
MEPFRPMLADSAVITCINTGMVKPRDFITNRNGCAMQPAAKKAILRAWEQRLDQLTTHPNSATAAPGAPSSASRPACSSAWLRGDIPHLPWPVVR